MMFESKYPFIFILFTFTCILFVGCEDRNISPFEEKTGTYSMYGALKIDDSPNYIRVKNLNTPFLSKKAKSLDAKVTFEDLQTGSRNILEDTVVNFSGHYTHNFIVKQKMDPASTYKVTVDGKAAEEPITSTITTPDITQISLSDPDSVACTQQITFNYKNVPDPESIRMKIGFKYKGQYKWSEVGKVDQVKHRENTDEMYLTLSTRQLLVEVFPPPEIGNRNVNPLYLNPTVSCNQLDSKTVRVKYLHFGPDWEHANGGYGPENPLQSPDIDGGLGFVGAYREGTFTYDFYTSAGN
ncbi:hypothetical protein [Fodinibius halophilus]|uniref:DUF4249 family protein n=1 Tax=Fodinibius halophilus TaxID=1736908 RepID=A0A6M1TAA8_9BACT|nr:hypothetical protein [Fodinibius halophilus]NGP87282.1 hypothetical protein [Fodinibius halophilus]